MPCASATVTFAVVVSLPLAVIEAGSSVSATESTAPAFCVRVAVFDSAPSVAVIVASPAVVVDVMRTV